MYLFDNDSIANTKGRVHRRRRYIAEMGEGRPKKKNDEKS